jgi:hypothetical protein
LKALWMMAMEAGSDWGRFGWNTMV